MNFLFLFDRQSTGSTVSWLPASITEFILHCSRLVCIKKKEAGVVKCSLMFVPDSTVHLRYLVALFLMKLKTSFFEDLEKQIKYVCVTHALKSPAYK